MSETSEDNFSTSNYNMESVMYDKLNLKKQSNNLDILIEYSDGLGEKFERVGDSIDEYSRCINDTSLIPKRLKYLVTALLDDLSSLTINKRNYDVKFSCPSCEGTLYQPVTISCGHTYCKNCLDMCKCCCLCGIKICNIGEINVLIKRLVEKWWPKEAEASKARHEGDDLLKNGHFLQALEHYNVAVKFGELLSFYIFKFSFTFYNHLMNLYNYYFHAQLKILKYRFFNFSYNTKISIVMKAFSFIYLFILIKNI